MVDYEEELDRYLDEIKELARSKQYARLRTSFSPWSLPTSLYCWRSPAGS